MYRAPRHYFISDANNVHIVAAFSLEDLHKSAFKIHFLGEVNGLSRETHDDIMNEL